MKKSKNNKQIDDFLKWGDMMNQSLTDKIRDKMAAYKKLDERINSMVGDRPKFSEKDIEALMYELGNIKVQAAGLISEIHGIDLEIAERMITDKRHRENLYRILEL